MKIEELFIDEQKDNSGVLAISLVEEPAIEEYMIFMNKNRMNVCLAQIDTEKKIIISPALIPNKMILRYNEENNEEFYIYFNKDTVRKCSQNYMMENFNRFTIDHNSEVNDVKLVESWIVDNPTNDKINHYGFNVNEGTWCVSLKIENEQLWESIKTGKRKGLSIEGYFTNTFQKYSKDKLSLETKIEILKSIYQSDISDDDKINKIKNIL